MTESAGQEIRIDLATLADLDAIHAIENAGFELDRFSRRTLRYLLDRSHSVRLIARIDGTPVGYSISLLKRGTSLARLYSLTVLPSYRRRGIASALLDASETEARRHGCVFMRLEVRSDNQAGLQMYVEKGYRHLSDKLDYYEDHQAAVCLEKRLRFPAPVHRIELSHYAQTTEFTCGPSALMMAMSAQDAALAMSQRAELQLWRESTTIFMTAGHGGCGPHGLALAAHRRGFPVELWISTREPLFLAGVRSQRKREVITLVQRSFEDELQQAGIETQYRIPSIDDLHVRIDRGWIPLALISNYRIGRTKAPHWVVVSGYDQGYIYVHDPDLESGLPLASASDMSFVPIPNDSFRSMSKFGKHRLSAFVFIGRPQPVKD